MFYWRIPRKTWGKKILNIKKMGSKPKGLHSCACKRSLIKELTKAMFVFIIGYQQLGKSFFRTDLFIFCYEGTSNLGFYPEKPTASLGACCEPAIDIPGENHSGAFTDQGERQPRYRHFKRNIEVEPYTVPSRAKALGGFYFPKS